MGNRYSLRFESGEREGEELPLSAPRFTVGRKPGNTLQILEASVSGKHAELVVDERGVLLRDLGSTNGTRVGAERVLEQRVTGGDVITFGNVPLRLVDAELGAASSASPAAPAAARGGASSVGAGEGIGEISADMVAESGRRSRAGLLVALALVLAGGGAAWYFLLGGGGGEGGASVRPVEPVEGNLLADGYSFETDEHGWSSSEEAPADFVRRGSARHGGEYGMQTQLEGGERAQLASPVVSAGDGRVLTLRAALEGEDDAAGRVGLELLGADGATDGPLYCWSDWVGGGGGFEPVELEVAPPPGCRRARVLVEGRAGAGGGRVAADDVSLVARVGTPAPASKVGEWDLFLLGDPAQTAALYKVSRRLIGDLSVTRGESDAAPEAVALSVTNEGGVLVLRAQGAGDGATLSLRAEPEALRLGLATMGESGYRPHGAELRREDASALLLGADRDLVALRFEQPATVVGTAEGDGSRLRVPLAGGVVRVQLDFTAERAEAGTLAMRARDALSGNRRGECLRAWRRLLREYPYEEALVAEAEQTRARLVQEGMDELQAVKEELERAQFFRLVDLYRRCRERAVAVGQRYASSEVEVAAQEVVAEVEASLASLETDRGADEVRRLEAIVGVLDAQEATKLAAEVRSYLAEEYGVDGRDGQQ